MIRSCYFSTPLKYLKTGTNTPVSQSVWVVCFGFKLCDSVERFFPSSKLYHDLFPVIELNSGVLDLGFQISQIFFSIVLFLHEVFAIMKHTTVYLHLKDF